MGVQVLEELDSAGVEVGVSPHLDELGTWVNAHLLVPFALHNNLLWLVAQLVQEHGLDDTIVHSYRRVVSTLLVLLRHTRIVRAELGLRGLRAKEHTVQGRFGNGLQEAKRGNSLVFRKNKHRKRMNIVVFHVNNCMFYIK